MLKVIVQIFKNNVFEGNTALMRKIVLLDCIDDITCRKSLFYRHQGQPFVRIRRMQADSQMTLALFKKPF